MAAGISRASKQENVSTTLSAGITDVATSMGVGDATQLNYPSYLVIDRVDASGTLKSTSLWEYVKVTNIVGSTLTITRAQGGSTQQSHSSGAVVEAVMTAALQEEYYAAFNPEHTATGGHIMANATILALENATFASASLASINHLYVSNIHSGVKGQFVWTSMGALVTSLATQPADSHLPTLRARKNLTINNCFVALNSAASLTALSINIDYRSTSTSPYSTIFTTIPTIDIGEYDTNTAATPNVLLLTSLASGTLLTPSIAASAGAGDLLVTLNCVERV